MSESASAPITTHIDHGTQPSNDGSTPQLPLSLPLQYLARVIFWTKALAAIGVVGLALTQHLQRRMPLFLTLIFVLAGMVCAAIGHATVSRGELRQSGYWLLAAVIIPYGGAQALWAGADWQLLLSALLLIAIIGRLTLRRWQRWGTVILAHLTWNVLLIFGSPFSRFPMQNLLSPYLPLVVVTVVLARLVWQLTQFEGDIKSLSRTVTKLQQKDTQLRRQLTELSVLHAVAVAGTVARSEDELLQRATQALEELFYAHPFGFLLLDPQHQILHVHPSYHFADSEQDFTPIPLSRGITGKVAQEGVPLRVSNVERSPEYFQASKTTKSELCVPLQVNDRMIGVINVESAQVDAFSAADEQLLLTIAGQIATALERLRRGTEARERTRQMAALYDLGHQLTSILALEELLPTVGRLIADSLGFYNVEIALLENRRLVFHAGCGGYTTPDGHIEPHASLRLGEGITGRAAQQGEPLLVPDVNLAADYVPCPTLPHAGAELAVPLKAQGQVIGVLDVKSDRPHGISPQEAALVETLAAQVAVAVHNAQLFQQILEQTEELGALFRTAHRANHRMLILHSTSQHFVTARVDAEEVYQAIHEAAAQLMPCEAFVISLLDEEAQEIELVYLIDRSGRIPAQRISATEGLSGRIIRTGAALRIEDLLTEPLATARHFGDPETVRSVLAVPLKLGGRVLGTLSAQSYTPQAYTEDDQRILELLASHAAAALENVRLLQAEHERRLELESVRQASLQVTSNLDLESVLHTILERSLELIGADNGHIFLYDGRTLAFGAGLWADGTPMEEPVVEPREKGVTNTVAQTGERIVVPNMGTHPLFNMSHWRGAIIGLPLSVGAKVTGVMNIAFEQPHEFNDNELRVLSLLADQAAIAIRNAALFEGAQRQVEALRLLHAVATACAEITDEDTLIEETTVLIGEAFYPENFGLMLYNQDTGRLHFHPTYRGVTEAQRKRSFSLEEGVVGWVARTGRPLLASDVTEEPRYLPFISGVQSELCVPLIAGDRVLGVLNAESRRAGAYTEEDERLLLTLAGQLATSIEKVRLFAEVEERAVELSEALARLEELDTLKDEFIQNVSHELRTPLAIIRGYTELLVEGELGTLTEEQKTTLTIVARRAQMLSQLVGDLTTILETEGRALEYESVEMVGLAHSVLDDFHVNFTEAQLGLHAEIAAESAIVSGDPLHLRRVLDNLLGNALKFTPEGGTVTLRLQVNDHHLLIAISDTGIGIPADKLDRIFERFYQVDGSRKRRYGGTGLGLALVKEIVEAHGGCVGVESVLDEGTTFHIHLPLME